MRDTLRLHFDVDTDGTGELFAEVKAKGFAGASSAWFGVNQLVAFAQERAQTYPLQSGLPLTLEGGFWSKSGAVVEQLHLGLKFYPIGSVGVVGCRVAERVSSPALRGWSEKEGSLFVQAPPGVLEQLVAVRVHLDGCAAQDGPLRVIPGTHTLGRIEPEAAAAIRGAATEVVCHAKRGEALVLRPLLLHASSKAAGTSRRRVLHYLFGPRQLPHGLRWQHAV